MSIERTRPAIVLLAEDNESDFILTKRAFERARLTLDLHRVSNGERCMAFLRKEEPFQDAPTPDLILLDLNMPVMDGREVLAELVKDAAFCHLPVVILTTASEHLEIKRLYALRVSSYIRKPVDFDQFVRVIRDLGHYWFTVVVLPSD